MKKVQPITKNILFNEVKESQSLYEKTKVIIDPLYDFVFDLQCLPEKELKNYFLDAEDLEKIRYAMEIHNTINNSAYNWGRKKAIQLVKCA